MEIKKVRVHTCTQRIDGYIEKKCKCRKFATLAKAEQLKDDGFAANVVISYKTIKIEDICPICSNDSNLKKSCNLCGKTGQVLKEKHSFEYGEDIYMTPFQRTPRTATIEEEHIEYAFIKGDRDAVRRIELYHQLDQLSLAKLGAELRDPKTGDILFEGTPEPANDPKTATGRDYDFGRPI
jgi:hypothetical protein